MEQENIKNYWYADLFDRYDDYLESLIESIQPRTVCDIGGGRNPQLGLDYVQKHQLDYSVLDIAQQELDNAPPEYKKICADVGSREFEIDETFDFVFSRMVAEHIQDGEQFHRNIFDMLKPGGVAYHFFPTLYSVPFTVNRLIPEWLSDPILNLVAPRHDMVQFGKFPAYYSWTRGPTHRQLARFDSVGFEVIRYAAGFGHNYYKRLPLVRTAGQSLGRFLLKHPNYWFCSFVFTVLRRPDPQNPNHNADSRALPWP
ncbi:Methyltransferase domain protein [Planctomycetes bacterium CA13]|uniref:Methyltransferase domain protein n=1 Tax=Novipirellula herctigrandis TaxID=2527986 RepID=A0A5C5YXC3_9BACT|nr:Methyltransferase domain protein [Planctomycetes bacterium CA13]